MGRLVSLFALLLAVPVFADEPTLSRVTLSAQVSPSEAAMAVSTETQGMWLRSAHPNAAQPGQYQGVVHRIDAAWAPGFGLAFGVEQAIRQQTTDTVQMASTVAEARWRPSERMWLPAIVAAARLRQQGSRSSSAYAGAAVRETFGMWKVVAEVGAETAFDGTGSGMRYQAGISRRLATDWQVGLQAWGNTSFGGDLDPAAHRVAADVRWRLRWNSGGVWIGPSAGIGTTWRNGERFLDWTCLAQIGISR